jgi:hypothetical protein
MYGIPDCNEPKSVIDERDDWTAKALLLLADFLLCRVRAYRLLHARDGFR